MERPQALANLWLIIQTIGWVMALEGVAEFVSERQYHTLVRQLIALIFGRDPASPKQPDDWAEWYNS